MGDKLKLMMLGESRFAGIIPLAVFSMLLLIMVPVPAFILDILLLINIAVAALIFLMSLQAKNVLEFTVLPTMLIFTTLSRIVLNVSSTRLILGGASGGKVIEAIGSLTIGGDYVLGVIVFVIITLIMFLVVNKGTERVSEVSARFILDGMPGKQMSIDADLSSGAIDGKAAQKRRAELERESDFYKSMDGASKFIKGDAIAGLIITVVNILGGLIMGMTRHGMAVGEAASKYTILSVGDGLVNQLPSLLIGAAAAFMVTRGNTKEGMVNDIAFQFLKYKEPFRIISFIMGAIGLLSLVGIVPGIPWWVCFVLSGLCYALTLIDVESLKNDLSEEEEIVDAGEFVEEREANSLQIEKITMHVGMNVVNTIIGEENIMAGKNQLSVELKYRIEVLRDNIKEKYGIKIPEIRIKEDNYIPSNAFLVRIANTPSTSLNVKPNCIFAMFFGDNTVVDFGEECEIRELGMRGYWVAKEDQENVEDMGAITYTMYDIIIQYLEYVVVNNLDKLISREEIKLFKKEVEGYNAAIIEEINQKQIENSVIQKVVQGLLAEKIPIRNFEYILECIADVYTEFTRGQIKIDGILQYVRRNIADTITADLIEEGVLKVVVLGSSSSEKLLRRYSGEISEALETSCMGVFNGIADAYKLYTDMGQKFVFLCDRRIRTELFRTISDYGIKANIVSYEELPRFVKMETIKTI